MPSNPPPTWQDKLDAILAKAQSPSIEIQDKELPIVEDILSNPKNYALLKQKHEELKEFLSNCRSHFDADSLKRLETFIKTCEKELGRWDRKLDAILEKDDPNRNRGVMILIIPQELPTVSEIEMTAGNIAKLKGYVERLKYFRLNNRLVDVSHSYLEMFISNCEKAFFEQGQKKEPYLNQILNGEKWLSAGLALMLVVLLIIPVLICYVTSRNGFYTDSVLVEGDQFINHEELEGTSHESSSSAEKTQYPHGPAADKAQPPAEKVKQLPQGPAAEKAKQASAVDKNASNEKKTNGVKTSTSSKYHSVSHANWVAILGFAVFVLVYFVFVVLLAILYFKTLKKIRQHQHRQILHDDLSALASLMSVKIDSNDATGLEMRKRIMRIMMPDDTED